MDSKVPEKSEKKFRVTLCWIGCFTAIFMIVLVLTAFIALVFWDVPVNSTASFVVDCPPEWSEHHENSCYMFVKKTMNWSDADFFCRSHGGHLAIVNNAEEQQFLDNYLKANQAEYGLSLWLDGTDTEVEGQWYWNFTGMCIDGHSYTNWRPNEPNNLRGDENCMDYGMAYNYNWNDVACFRFKQSICEKD